MPDEKPRYISVTDPEIEDELLASRDEIGTPYSYKSPDGTTWVEDNGELERWKVARDESP